MVTGQMKEKTRIAIAFHYLATVQKNYGKPIDVRETIKAWEFVMASKYTANQVIAAMRAYLEKSSDMPTRRPDKNYITARAAHNARRIQECA